MRDVTGGKGRGGGPGLGQRRVLREQPVGEPRRDEHGIKPAVLRGLGHPPQVVERRRTLRPQRAGAVSVAVYGYEPVKARFGRCLFPLKLP